MGYRYIGSKARIADEIIEYINRTTFVEAFSSMLFLELGS